MSGYETYPCCVLSRLVVENERIHKAKHCIARIEKRDDNDSVDADQCPIQADDLQDGRKDGQEDGKDGCDIEKLPSVAP
jgi:hypothetical protein